MGELQAAMEAAAADPAVRVIVLAATAGLLLGPQSERDHRAPRRSGQGAAISQRCSTAAPG